MATTVVEIHVPLTPDTTVGEGEDRFPWIADLEQFVEDLEEEGEIFVVETGDEFEGSYVIVVTGAGEQELLAVANRVGNLPGIPSGVVAFVTDDEADDLGQGQQVEIS